MSSENGRGFGFCSWRGDLVQYSCLREESLREERGKLYYSGSLREERDTNYFAEQDRNKCFVRVKMRSGFESEMRTGSFQLQCPFLAESWDIDDCLYDFARATKL